MQLSPTEAKQVLGLVPLGKPPTELVQPQYANELEDMVRWRAGIHLRLMKSYLSPN